MTRARRIAAPLLFFGGLVVLWEAAVRRSGDFALFPYPSGIAEAAFRRLNDGTLISAATGSLGRVLVGFAIGAALGTPLGLAMGLAPPVRRAIGPIVDSLRSVAPIAWIPMALLWLGIRGNAALFVIAYATFFPFVLNTVQAVQLVDRVLVSAARNLGAGRTLMLRGVILPSALPVILTGARISLGFAWGSVIAAELAIGIKVHSGTEAAVGVGQQMVNTLYFHRDVNALVLYMLVIALISLAIDRGLRGAQRALTPWRQT